MMFGHHAPQPARPRTGAVRVVVLITALSTGLLAPLGVAHAATTVPLGTAEGFAILAGSTITNTGPSTVTGDIGLHPGSAVTGFDDITQDGSLHVADEVARQAKADLDAAYTDAVGQTPVTRIGTELGGTTLTAGVYDSASGTFGITGTITLDGQGDPDAVFIFLMGSTLTTAAASTVAVINGADLCNVHWQVGSSATLGTNSTFLGSILADQSITLTSGARVEGRILARVGAVTLDTNTVTNAACTTPAPAVTPTPTEDVVTPTDDDTTDQIVDVPAGPVATGGGDTPTGSTGRQLPSVIVLALLMVGGTAGVIAWRRVRD